MILEEEDSPKEKEEEVERESEKIEVMLDPWVFTEEKEKHEII